MTGLKPFTPDRKLLENRRGFSNGRLNKNVFVKKKKSSSNSKVASDKSVPGRRCIAKEMDVEASENDAEIKESVTQNVVDPTKREKSDTSEASQMSSLVRDRLLDRIVSLASRGAITPSQQKYLNSLINVDDSSKSNDACPEQSKVLVPKPPEDALKSKSSLVIRSLKYNDVNDSERRVHKPRLGITLSTNWRG